MDKLYSPDGEKVAVLYSPGYGAGWSTWVGRGYEEQSVFDPDLASAVLAKAGPADLKFIAKRKYPDAYLGGLEDLDVKWVPKGKRFRIHEYDGNESVILEDEDVFYTA